MKLKRLRRGNGVFIYGCFMLLLIYALVIGVIQTYAIRQMALKAQNAVDSIADGVAIYMMFKRFVNTKFNFLAVKF